jgi:xylulokinase
VVEAPTVEAIPKGMDMNFHPAPRCWTVSQSLGGLGASLEWWLNQSWQGLKSLPPATRTEMYAALNEELAQTSPGSDDVTFLPLAGGHEEPAGIQRGGFVGLRLGHTRGDMARSILEGAAFELRWALENIRQAGMSVEHLWMVGGAARSPVWPKIVADVTGVSLSLTQYAHWPALGAAILAGWGAGIFESPEAGQACFQKLARHIGPDKSCQQLYDEHFAVYQQLRKLVIA